RFGVGFLDIGPITVEPIRAAVEVERLADREAIGFPEPFPNPGLDALARRLERDGPLGVPLIVRLGVPPGTPPAQATAECRRMIDRLAPHAALFALATGKAAAGWTDADWSEHVAAAVVAAPRPLLLC